MTIALYTTIWIALLCLVLGELGRGRLRRTNVQPWWAWPVSAVGPALAIVHSLIALGHFYGWDHHQAAAITAARSGAVYGISWPGALYVNYLFLGWWATDVTWWRLAPSTFIRRPPFVEWTWRVLVFIMAANGAIVFASPAGRWAGVPLVAALLLVWRRDPLSPRSSS